VGGDKRISRQAHASGNPRGFQFSSYHWWVTKKAHKKNAFFVRPHQWRRKWLACQRPRAPVTCVTDFCLGVQARTKVFGNTRSLGALKALLLLSLHGWGCVPERQFFIQRKTGTPLRVDLQSTTHPFSQPWDGVSGNHLWTRPSKTLTSTTVPDERVVGTFRSKCQCQSWPVFQRKIPARQSLGTPSSMSLRAFCSTKWVFKSLTSGGKCPWSTIVSRGHDQGRPQR